MAARFAWKAKSERVHVSRCFCPPVSFELPPNPLSCRVRARFLNLVGDYFEPCQATAAERGCNRDVRGVAAHRHHHPTDSWLVVPCIEGPPAVLQIHFEPGAEIHLIRRWGNADISQIAGDITRRNIQAATKRDCQMLKIPAHPESFCINIQSRLGRPRKVVAERNLPMGPI